MQLQEGKNNHNESLAVSGSFPSWLQGGSIFRNGPGLFNLANQRMNHWFDGYSYIQKFAFGESGVQYHSKFVESQDYLASTKSGKVEYLNFATNPKQNIFKSAMQLIRGSISDNPNVNILRFNGSMLALGEITGNYEIDAKTLATKGAFDFEQVNNEDPSGGDIAHPVYDSSTQEYINVGIKLGRENLNYVYAVTKGSNSKRIIWKKTVDQIRYFHSFAVTPQHIVLIRPPFISNTTRLLTKPFIDSYRWQPDKQTEIIIIERSTGKETITYAPPFFFFHIANAFESDGKICVDISTYPDSHAISDGFRTQNIESDEYSFDGCSLQRLTIDMTSFKTELHELYEGVFEFPSIHYRSDMNNPEYSTIYGVTSSGEDFFGILTQLNLTTGTTQTWSQKGCYAGEPMIVHNPEDQKEFVILSLVYDTINSCAFIIALDDQLNEIARATTSMGVPMSFHGSFVFEK